MKNNIVTSWILVLRPSCGSELTTKSDTRLIHDDTRSSISFHKRNWHNLVSLEKFSVEKIENSIGTRVDMELLFECSTRHLIHSLCSIVRYRGQHYVRDKKKTPLPLTDKEGFAIHLPTWQWRERQVTCQQLIGDINHTSKKLLELYTCGFTTFHREGNPF